MTIATRLGLASLLLAALGCAAPVPVHTGTPPWLLDDDEEEVVEEEAESHGFGHRLLFYIPNRIFDVFDIVRARLRLGPGFGISVRATELADVTVAAYTTAWIGLHGPRPVPSIPWPVGLETVATAEVSVVGGEASYDAMSPNYGPVEIGVGVQVLIIGLDVGVEPWEIIDLVAGLLTFDLAGDDY